MSQDNKYNNNLFKTERDDLGHMLSSAPDGFDKMEETLLNQFLEETNPDHPLNPLSTDYNTENLGINNDILFSPSSDSNNSPQLVQTPTFIVENHDQSHLNVNKNVKSLTINSDIRAPTLAPATQYLSPRSAHSTDNQNSYSSDVDSDFNNISTALSPSVSASSYLSDNDDLLSVYSNNSFASSSNLLPVNSHGYKHVANLSDLDQILGDSITLLDNDFDFATMTTLQNDKVNPVSNNTPPMISVQEFKEQSTSTTNHDINTNKELLQMGSELILKFENMKNPNLLNASAIHEEMLTGRKVRRKSISRQNSTSSRSRSRSRRKSSSTMSQDEKARSISANRAKLLEMADLAIDDDDDNQNAISNDEMDIYVKLEEENNEIPPNLDIRKTNSKKNPQLYTCEVCDKKFTRPYNLKSHLRTHTNERPFACTICGKAFARQHDRKRHEDLHSGKKRYACGGKLKSGIPWGCGKKFARSDALGRHFKTDCGRKCIAPLYEEAAQEKAFNENNTTETDTLANLNG
ncbi:hypothetical protein KAFR_0H03240 [Kazachstania africana CBS 2517]|uniref:C2H2-type domain-containing protein n=1 Tax=Kazachstania africana (strain ATCC 22294 / BCRC 22015 / CBS 2517 / CECT 1963 / NBRC 1671 / NRRL Y-8276) TaxID=1071382 RepID=H2AZH8_KAZAF|nr:hypothetical protein KAFR_0H03240 [Kazachstania africana CBS 2517]CCF59734.1 hypothetical protein KAFR_0H03240 [Kazachstania africana CBS 2517]